MPADDPRDDFIQRVVRGRSFVDVGGLWGTINEKVSVAHRAGASELAMVDVTPEGNELWRLFHARLREVGVDAPVTCRVGDVSEYRDRRYDVVHCSGVLYHHPNPLTIVTGLARACNEHLVLTSAITPNKIENRAGRWELPPSAVLFVPALTTAEQVILDEHWKAIGADVLGITKPAQYRIDEQNRTDMAPWWWLPTADALQSMAEVCGFRTLDRRLTWGGNACSLLLQKLA